MKEKDRLDVLMVERGLAPTRANARALIMAGQVVVGEHAAEKAGQMVNRDQEIRLKGEYNPYVSRGGLKLKAALDGFGFDPSGMNCIDIGASTGGFTDCLLQSGAAGVLAVDVGYGQLAWKLRSDPRVRVLERQNIRNLDPALTGGPADLVVVDASFISVTLFLDKVYDLLKSGGTAIVLVKPQFEAERGEVGKGGVVKDEALRRKALMKVLAGAEEQGFRTEGVIESPIPGAKKGNVEYLAKLVKTEGV